MAAHPRQRLRVVIMALDPRHVRNCCCKVLASLHRARCLGKHTNRGRQCATDAKVTSCSCPVRAAQPSCLHCQSFHLVLQLLSLYNSRRAFSARSHPEHSCRTPRPSRHCPDRDRCPHCLVVATINSATFKHCQADVASLTCKRAAPVLHPSEGQIQIAGMPALPLSCCHTWQAPAGTAGVCRIWQQDGVAQA